MKLILAAVAAVALLAAPALAQGGSVLVRGAGVFDGERMIGQRDVLVENGRIARVGTALAAPAGVPVAEGRGRTLLPGLIDSHVHVFPTAAEDALRFGVTTEFDMFTLATPAEVAQRHAQRLSYARTDKADMWSAGIGATPPGGHPSQLAQAMGRLMPTLAPGADADAFVRARVAEGSDYIKIFQEPGRKTQLPHFTPEQLKQVIDATHRAGRKAIVHVSCLADARLVFADGGDAIAHMFEDVVADDEVVALAKAHGSVVIGTFSVLASVAASGDSARLAADQAVAPFLSPAQAGMLAQGFPSPSGDTLANALASERRFLAGGVTILAGTDAPNPGTAHGPSLHEELELLVRGGMTPVQALTAATAAPARFFGTADRGRIAEGLRGDLILVEGDPSVDILATRRIVGIWKNGWPVDRAKLPVMPRRKP